jgi:hypothetical protein
MLSKLGNRQKRQYGKIAALRLPPRHCANAACGTSD